MVEVDESPFGHAKHPAFGRYERGGAVIESTPDCSVKTLQTIITRGKVFPAHIARPDGRKRYAGLMDAEYNKYYFYK